MTLTLICLAIAVLLMAVSSIWMVVAGFRVSVLWGFLILLVPLTPVVFLFVNWKEARKPFFCGLIGVLALVPAVILNWSTIYARKDLVVKAIQDAQAGRPPTTFATPPPTPSAPTLAEKQATLLAHANEMNAKYQDLMTRQPLLNPGDAPAVAAFNADREAYRALRQKVEMEKAEIEALQSAASR